MSTLTKQSFEDIGVTKLELGHEGLPGKSLIETRAEAAGESTNGAQTSQPRAAPWVKRGMD